VELQNLIVARYLDGRVLKGTTHDFSPTRPSFHLEVGAAHEVVELRLRQLKAVFFVKSFEGDPAHEHIPGFIEGPEERPQGRKIAVRFRDGEFLCGYTMSWSPDRDGFFVFPTDKSSNNDRIYVVASSTDEIKSGPQAEALAQRAAAGAAAQGPAGPAVAPRGLNPPPSIGPRPSPSSIGPRPSPSSLGPRPVPGPSGPRPPVLGPRPRSDAG
jgi:hypothetical protein